MKSLFEAINSSDNPIVQLQKKLDELDISTNRSQLLSESLAEKGLTKMQAQAAKKLLWEDYVKHIKHVHKYVFEGNVIFSDKFPMKFMFRVFGEKPRGWLPIIYLNAWRWRCSS